MSVDKINFTGSEPIMTGASKTFDYAEKYARELNLRKEISEMMPKAIKTIGKFSKFTGEVPNIIINALGTGLIAPIFIKYNFLSKTDEDTRTYSAFRQPISAVLAVLTQAGMVIPINRVIDNMSNTGQFNDSKYNKAGFQDVKYLKKELKKKFPKMSAKQLDDLANKKYIENLQNLIETAYNENSIVYKLKGKEVRLSPEGVEKILNQTTDDMLKNVTQNLSNIGAGASESVINQLKSEKAVIERMKLAIKEKATIKEVAEIAKNIPDQSFLYDLAQKHISNVGANLKGYGQVIGLVVSLAILPITCSMLNYAYPKIMKTLFPNLSAKKDKTPKDTFEKACSETVMRGRIPSDKEVHR